MELASGSFRIFKEVLSILIFYSLSLIPENHLLRKIDRMVSFDFIYDFLAPYYPATGRPSVDPVSMFKMLLIGYLYGIKSERRLVEEVQLNIAYRWFCGFELDDAVPDHSTFSKTRTRKWQQSSLFQKAFYEIVKQCIAGGLIDGKAISEQVKQEIAAEVAEIVAHGGKRPHLAAILVGHDGGSETYVAAKVKACEVCGFKSSLIRYESDVTEEELLAKVRELNEDADVDGFIVQLPLPKHISEQKVIETIDYRKDVDGFHPINVGRMSIGLPCYVSATPNGILELLKRYKIETSGKKCVVLGRSNIVGKPMAALMMQKAYPGDATVTVCHSRSHDLVKECQEADIIIAALGQPNFVKENMVKEGAVIIDVGTTRVPDATKKSGFKLTGDVKFDEVAPKCSYITPVPGGVGPMTIVSLMKNTLLAGKKAIYK